MLIQQRTTDDCVICTVAMALSASYEDVMAMALDNALYTAGVGCKRDYYLIERFGHRQMETFRVLDRGVLAPEFFLHLSWRRRAILAVPSLNFPGLHSVYFDGRAVQDPSTLRTYTNWKDLRPEEMILFADG